MNYLFYTGWGKLKTGFCSVVFREMNTTGRSPVPFGKSEIITGQNPI